MCSPASLFFVHRAGETDPKTYSSFIKKIGEMDQAERLTVQAQPPSLPVPGISSQLMSGMTSPYMVQPVVIQRQYPWGLPSYPVPIAPQSVFHAAQPVEEPRLSYHALPSPVPTPPLSADAQRQSPSYKRKRLPRGNSESPGPAEPPSKARKTATYKTHKSKDSASKNGGCSSGKGSKCRKVYGMDRKGEWCTPCKWKKACIRYTD